MIMITTIENLIMIMIMNTLKGCHNYDCNRNRTQVWL